MFVVGGGTMAGERPPLTATFSSLATRSAMLACTLKISESTPSYLCVHTVVSSETRTSCGVTRTRPGPGSLWSQRTLPERM